MGVGQLSESDAVDALRLPFYSSSHPTGSHGWRNQFDLGEVIPIHATLSLEPNWHREPMFLYGTIFGNAIQKSFWMWNHGGRHPQFLQMPKPVSFCQFESRGHIAT